MVKFIIVRHGKTDFNRLNKYQGQYDSSLEELGIRQAEITTEFVAKNYKLDAIYSSDLSRAVKTAEPFAKAFGLEINTTTALRELDVGNWTLQLVSEVEKNDPENMRAYRECIGTFRFPGGESFEEARDRAIKKIDEIAKDHDGQTVLLVSHGGTIRTVIAHWLGYPMAELDSVRSVKNTSLTVAEYTDGKVEFKLLGDNSHLPEDMR